jgi:hypothetical protein
MENTCIEPIVITKNTIQYMKNLEIRYQEIYQKIFQEIIIEIKNRDKNKLLK